MQTDSGFLLEVQGGNRCVYASDPEEYKMFAGQYGVLNEEWRDDEVFQKLEDGLYTVIFTYGSFCDGSNPHYNKYVRSVVKVCGPLDWMLGGVK
jgi:hypothetical protein